MKRICLLLIILVLTGAACGCTAQQNADGRYSAEFAYDPQQYMLFINKELQAPVNQMSSVLAALKKETSTETLEQLLCSAETTVSESLQSIRVMRPPAQYTETSERITGYLEEVKGLYGRLLDALETGSFSDEDTLVAAEQLQECYFLLTSEANTYWK